MKHSLSKSMPVSRNLKCRPKPPPRLFVDAIGSHVIPGPTPAPRPQRMPPSWFVHIIRMLYE